MSHGPKGEALEAKRTPQPALLDGPQPSRVPGSPGPFAGGGHSGGSVAGRDDAHGASLQLTHCDDG